MVANLARRSDGTVERFSITSESGIAQLDGTTSSRIPMGKSWYYTPFEVLATPFSGSFFDRKHVDRWSSSLSTIGDEKRARSRYRSGAERTPPFSFRIPGAPPFPGEPFAGTPG